ncbi:hypothetical protein VNO78_31905 [Psophocarpus tetragonolobus]|uniref:Uncharacterized protein n=1 Tax=Psophocarpus tetragonolobus TaxID=3891 RepID=A0AAN9RZ85_PSOTE
MAVHIYSGGEKGERRKEKGERRKEMEEGRKGYVPVLVGKEGKTEKIWVSIKAIQHPTIVELLDKSADELGYQQGLLRITSDVNFFKAIIHHLPLPFPSPNSISK